MFNSPNEVMDNGPTQDHFDLAFDRAVEDAELMQVFFDSCAAGPHSPIEIEPFTPYQLYHKFGGLPKMDKTEHDDAERDVWSDHMENVMDGYKLWLESTGQLHSLACIIQTEEIANNQAEAAEYAAECAIDHQEVQHLNGGW